MKLVISIIVGSALLAILCVWGAVTWWRSNSPGLMDGVKTSYAEGQKAGASLNENGCLDRALERGKDKANRGIGEAMKTQIGLSACLSASKLNPEFCKSVPLMDNPFSAGLWTGRICAQQGNDDPNCGGLMQEVVNYCSGPVRKAKLSSVEKAS